MRGQAFIILEDINSAMEARQKLQSRELYGKNGSTVIMQRISFAKEKSNAIAKVEGTFNLRERPKDYFQKKFEEKFVLRPKLQSERKKAENEKKQGRRIDQVWSLLRSTTAFPNHLLFAEGLTPAVTAEVLTSLFIKFPGLL